MKMPKNNEDKTFTTNELFKKNIICVRSLYFINNLKINPKVLPTNI